MYYRFKNKHRCIFYVSLSGWYSVYEAQLSLLRGHSSICYQHVCPSRSPFWATNCLFLSKNKKITIGRITNKIKVVDCPDLVNTKNQHEKFITNVSELRSQYFVLWKWDLCLVLNPPSPFADLGSSYLGGRGGVGREAYGCDKTWYKMMRRKKRHDLWSPKDYRTCFCACLKNSLTHEWRKNMSLSSRVEKHCALY